MVDLIKIDQIEMGVRIKRLREISGISVAQFALLIHVNSTTVKLIENGTRRMYADELLTISKFLNVDLLWLFGDVSISEGYRPRREAKKEQTPRT